MKLPWFPPDLLLLPALVPTEQPHLEETSLSPRQEAAFQLLTLHKQLSFPSGKVQTASKAC